MEFTAYQIITPLAGFIAVSYAWNLVFRQKKTLWEAILWTVFWGSIVAIALYPDVLDYLSKFTGIKDRENAVLITTIAILLFIVFYIIVRIEAMEQRQTRVIRKLALKDLDKK
ncbi:hypothetical protein CL635_01750 [bacterium]|nr:hypothetical protein [bacterium]|tara:strand:+ start:25295 stop:25633 length:339 start_codon:yes stop_codon:yes gene_type:complete